MSTWKICISYSLLYISCCYTHVQYLAQQSSALARSFHALHGYNTHTPALACHQMSIQKWRKNDISSNIETGPKTKSCCLAKHTTFCSTRVGASRFLLFCENIKSIFSGLWAFPLCTLAERLTCDATRSGSIDKPSLPAKVERKQSTSAGFPPNETFHYKNHAQWPFFFSLSKHLVIWNLFSSILNMYWSNLFRSEIGKFNFYSFFQTLSSLHFICLTFHCWFSALISMSNCMKAQNSKPQQNQLTEIQAVHPQCKTLFPFV